jgi:hypothetical protein
MSDKPFCDIPNCRRKALKVSIFCGPHERAGKLKVSIEEKKKLKADYDREYRAKNKESLKTKKDIYYKSPAGRAMQKRNRDKFKGSHAEYIKTPKYKAWKKEYDHKFRLKKQYGEFWEAGSVLVKLNEILPSKQIKYNQGLINKSQKRKKQWQRKKRN